MHKNKLAKSGYRLMDEAGSCKVYVRLRRVKSWIFGDCLVLDKGVRMSFSVGVDIRETFHRPERFF